MVKMKNIISEKQGLKYLPKAIIFDVDGTLYSQTKLRLFILLKIITSIILSPKCIHDFIVLMHFRKTREKISSQAIVDLENQQYLLAANSAYVKQEKVRQVVQKWMFEKPLPYLAACLHPGIKELFSLLKSKGIRIGVFSDYPAAAKLEALGLAADILVSASCKEVNCLKPNPTGLLVTARKLQTAVQDCLFIGDRWEKDGECARRAGMPYLILDPRRKTRQLHGLAAWLKDAEQN